MDVFEAIRTVLAVRRYQAKPVPAAVIGRVVEAGRLTASSINLQPWHFVVVEERATLGKIGRIMTTGPYATDAAFAIVVLIEKDSPYAVSDASRATQAMILAAWSEGVGSNWVGFGPLPEIEKLVGAPDTLEALAVVPFGYSAAKIGRGRKKRKPLAAVASRERYGTPFVQASASGSSASVRISRSGLSSGSRSAPVRFSQTQRTPAARAPATSFSRLSPIATTSAIGTPIRTAVSVKIRGSGFPAPMSDDATTTEKCRRRPETESLIRCTSAGPLVATAIA